MLTTIDYFMGRDHTYEAQLTPLLRANAMTMVTLANAVLALFGENRGVNSGWRPLAVNATTYGAAMNSKHITCQAIDLSDPDGDLDDWCMRNLDSLAKIGCWLEHPASTKGWCHLQSVPPKSGNRVFYP